MILVYVNNRQFGEVADLVFDGKVSYRNPDYWDGAEKCDKAYVHGDYPEVREAYKDKLINVQDSKESKLIAEPEYPIPKGAGWYELSDGSSVRGKEDAIKAEGNL